MPEVSHVGHFFQVVCVVAQAIDKEQIDALVADLVLVRHRGGRLFILGVGGSAGNASHAVNDFRKLCGIEAYAPTDNVSELTARTNDEGFGTIFSEWLRVSNLNSKDALLVLSVGGGNEERNISLNLVEAIKLAKSVSAKIFGIVGRRDGYTARHANNAIIIPPIEDKWVTPMSEAFQAIIWHCIVSHPLLKVNPTKW